MGCPHLGKRPMLCQKGALVGVSQQDKRSMLRPVAEGLGSPQLCASVRRRDGC